LTDRAFFGRHAAALAFFFLACALTGAESSERDKRLNVIQYGLESEVTELVSTLQTENDDSYDGELTKLFQTTRSSAVRSSILSLFAKQKKDTLGDYAVTVLDDPYDIDKSTVSAVFGYVTELRLTASLPAIRAILQGDNAEYRDSAISALGKIGESEDAQFLVGYFDGDIAGDEKTRLIIRQNVMTALGELKAVETFDKLMAVAQDEEENSVIRATAAVAIGKMKNGEAVPVLVKLFGSSDPAIRAASITALANFTDTEAVSTIVEGFKDSYYKVRLESIKAAQTMKASDMIGSLTYRAEHDPVKAVQLAAYETLGTLHTGKADEWLKDVFVNEKKSDELRVKASSVLLKENFDFIYPDVERVADSALKDDKKKWLRYELGKQLASIESQKTEKLAESYFSQKDVQTKSLGLDMFAKNRYASMKSQIQELAADEKQGALQRRAKAILDKD